MEIKVNGKTENIPDNITILDFLKQKNITFDNVVVEINQEIIKKENWQKTILQQCDKLELVQLVGGG